MQTKIDLKQQKQKLKRKQSEKMKWINQLNIMYTKMTIKTCNKSEQRWDEQSTTTYATKIHLQKITYKNGVKNS